MGARDPYYLLGQPNIAASVLVRSLSRGRGNNIPLESGGAANCVAVDAVRCEPVSELPFPCFQGNRQGIPARGGRIEQWLQP
jgi:hypothetical protein